MISPPGALTQSPHTGSESARGAIPEHVLNTGIGLRHVGLPDPTDVSLKSQDHFPDTSSQGSRPQPDGFANGDP